MTNSKLHFHKKRNANDRDHYDKEITSKDTKISKHNGVDHLTQRLHHCIVLYTEQNRDNSLLE